MGNQQSSGGPAGSSIAQREPLECVIREQQRDEHLKNLGFKRNKSIRKSIAKKLKKREKKKDEIDVGGDDVSTTPNNIPTITNYNDTAKKPVLATPGQIVETRTSIGGNVEGGAKVEVIKLDDKKVAGPLVGQAQPLPAHLQNNPPRKVDKLRRSIRRSMKKRKEGVGVELSKTQQWQIDEASVRSGTCNFYVKYLGCCEVFESRGMQVCEAAVRTLKMSKRRTVRGVLYVCGDSLKIVDEDTKGLVLDQTIEKVSFCAPDRNFEKGFSYICRDGTTRRWMCHAMMAIGDSGERLSHAVGCAFGICLERKQKREAVSVTMNYDSNESSFTRVGSFRQGTITERLADPQSLKPANDPVPVSSGSEEENAFAISRPRPSQLMYQRQASFRGLGQLSGNSPFKRGTKGQLSLRPNDLPSTKDRKGSSSIAGGHLCDSPILEDIELPPSNLETQDNVAGMCRQLRGGIDQLMPEDPFSLASDLAASGTSGASSPCPTTSRCSTTSLSPPPSLLQPVKLHPLPETNDLEKDYNPWDNVPDQPLSARSPQTVPIPTNTNPVQPSSLDTAATALTIPAFLSLTQPVATSLTIPAYLTVSHLPQLTQQPLTTANRDSSLAEDWLNTMDPLTAHQDLVQSHSTNGTSTGLNSPTSSNSATSVQNTTDSWLNINNQANIASSILEDPFDADWAALATRETVEMASDRRNSANTNPFIDKQTAIKAFELQL